MTLNIFTEKGTPFFLGIFFPLKSWLFHIHDLGYFHRKRLPFLARVYFNKKVIPSALYFILGVFFTHCYAVFRHHSSFCWQQLEDHQARLFPRRTCTMPTRKIKKKVTKKSLPCYMSMTLDIFTEKKTPLFLQESRIYFDSHLPKYWVDFLKHSKLRKSRWSPSSLKPTQYLGRWLSHKCAQSATHLQWSTHRIVLRIPNLRFFCHEKEFCDNYVQQL